MAPYRVCTAMLAHCAHYTQLYDFSRVNTVILQSLPCDCRSTACPVGWPRYSCFALAYSSSSAHDRSVLTGTTLRSRVLPECTGRRLEHHLTLVRTTLSDQRRAGLL